MCTECVIVSWPMQKIRTEAQREKEREEKSCGDGKKLMTYKTEVANLSGKEIQR